MDELSHHNTNDLTSKVKDKNIVHDESNGKVGFTNKEDTRVEPDFLGLTDKHDQKTWNPMNSLASSTSDQLTLTDFSYRKANDASLLDQSLCDPRNDDDNLVPCETGRTHEPMSIKNVEGCEKNIDQEIPENDKDKTIELLKEEVVIFTFNIVFPTI